jgi:hypothetical protein
VLVAANIGDMPVKVETAGLRGYAFYRSLHEMARWTHQETATAPMRRIPYARVEAARERARSGGVFGPKQGVSTARGTGDWADGYAAANRVSDTLAPAEAV